MIYCCQHKQNLFVADQPSQHFGPYQRETLLQVYAWHHEYNQNNDHDDQYHKNDHHEDKGFDYVVKHHRLSWPNIIGGAWTKKISLDILYIWSQAGVGKSMMM